jgi:glycosyltransferase involved in cell wall biosynthesis
MVFLLRQQIYLKGTTLNGRLGCCPWKHLHLHSFFKIDVNPKAMKVSGFTYVRNGLHLDYPFTESIRSLLPLVDELVVVVGDSHDGTREAVVAIGDPKIKIVDSVWPVEMRKGGKVFALQASIGLDHCSPDADWIITLQADELFHEKEVPVIRKYMEEALNESQIEGFLFRFLNFFGDFNHYAPSRRYHQHEIRIIRNGINARPYRDSQGFRIFSNNDDEQTARKLKVWCIPCTVYHYSYVKNPKTQLLKQAEFGSRWHDGDDYVSRFLAANPDGFDYGQIDYLAEFNGVHPSLMEQRIRSQDWVFNYDPSVSNMSFKEKLLRQVEKWTGRQFFINKNFKIVKSVG